MAEDLLDLMPGVRHLAINPPPHRPGREHPKVNGAELAEKIHDETAYAHAVWSPIGDPGASRFARLKSSRFKQ
jgi:hypothetical protein